MSKKLSTATESELETRLHHLTENLIQKQTLVESLSTEKNSLKLQLERSEQQLRDMEKIAQRSSSSVSLLFNLLALASSFFSHHRIHYLACQRLKR